MDKLKKVMKKPLMQIIVECFGVVYRLKVKNMIEMQSGSKNWNKVAIRSRSAWLLLRRWFLSKLGKLPNGKLQEEIKFKLA